MKTLNIFKPILLGTLAVGVSAFLPSCVEPMHHGPDRGPSPRHGQEMEHGRVIRELPRGYRTETINGTRYYRHNETYYRQSNGGYLEVQAPSSHAPDYRSNANSHSRKATDETKKNWNSDDRTRDAAKPGNGNWTPRDSN
jgi:hypothetical protein